MRTVLIIIALFLIVLADINHHNTCYAQSQGKIKVAVTLPDLVPLVSFIGGASVDVSGIMPPGADPHSFTLSADTLRMIERSDIIVFGKSDFLHFETELIQAVSEKRRVDWPDYQKRGALLNEFPGYEVNEHGFWLGHKNAKAIAGAVAEAIISLGGDIDTITTNLTVFNKEIDLINQGGMKLIEELDRTRSTWVAMVPGVAYIIDNLGLSVGSIVLIEGAGFVSGYELAQIENNLYENVYAGIICPLSMKDSKAGEMARQLARDTQAPVCYVRFNDTPSDGSYLAQASYNSGAIATAAAWHTQATQIGGVPISGHIIWAVIVFSLLITIVMMNKRLYWSSQT